MNGRGTVRDTMSMQPQTRQTLIGVIGLTVVEVVALIEGYNGHVLLSYFVTVTGLVAPEVLEQLPVDFGGGR